MGHNKHWISKPGIPSRITCNDNPIVFDSAATNPITSSELIWFDMEKYISQMSAGTPATVTIIKLIRTELFNRAEKLNLRDSLSANRQVFRTMGLLHVISLLCHTVKCKITGIKVVCNKTTTHDSNNDINNRYFSLLRKKNCKCKYI